jgi:hypothetical protein
VRLKLARVGLNRLATAEATGLKVLRKGIEDMPSEVRKASRLD